uniref:Calcineurin-like phosphoesterase domain-containing protein n=1 Tax=Strigamia maritima TaxID=126957 RepID=T1JLX0_STRMM
MSKNRMLHLINWSYILKLFLALMTILFVCEVLIYYIVLLKCSWPQLNDALADSSVKLTANYKPVKAMILADTHLLGWKRGHWFDKLRREWQMHRSFQTVMTIHNPDIVFFLGDIFDEGQWADAMEFRHYVQRFHVLFQVPEKTQVFVVAGNHDIGFHYVTNQHLNSRFTDAFAAPAVKSVVIEGNIFIMINSIAMEGDKCSLCGPAEKKLKELSKLLHCDHMKSRKCKTITGAPNNSRPILFLHMPLFRKSEAVCTEIDSVPPELKYIPNNEKWECLSKNATNKLLKWLEPRLVLDGHVHHSCHLLHPGAVPEWTVASFSWRNKNNPSFLLVVNLSPATITPNNFAVSKCYMPQESTVITLYVISSLGLLLWIVATRRRICRSSSYIYYAFKTKCLV